MYARCVEQHHSQLELLRLHHGQHLEALKVAGQEVSVLGDLLRRLTRDLHQDTATVGAALDDAGVHLFEVRVVERAVAPRLAVKADPRGPEGGQEAVLRVLAADGADEDVLRSD